MPTAMLGQRSALAFGVYYTQTSRLVFKCSPLYISGSDTSHFTIHEHHLQPLFA